MSKIIIEKSRAVAVEFRRGSSTAAERANAEQEVVVTAGAIGSPKLLMLSGIGPAAHLESVGIAVEADVPGVGGNLQDHLDCYTVYDCNGPHSYYGTNQYVKHPVGTCKIGNDDLAVVDAMLRVRGIEALRVCDSSVMPLEISANTNAPTIMIAERASDMILDREIMARRRNHAEE